uniref:SKP1-like protein n=1 Tax=Oryza punctata TaxID=4537 RepID=A0A0E0LJM2_ORYPU
MASVAADKSGEGEEKAGGKTISVKCSDGQTFDMPVAAAMLSTAIRKSFDTPPSTDHGGDIELPHQVSSGIFPKVKEYCTKHAKVDDKGNTTVSTNTGGESSSSTSEEEEDLKNWDKEFVNIEVKPLHDLLLAAHFLDIKGLFDITCRKVADMLKGKTSEEMRQILSIPNDFTEEEHKAIKENNPWVFPDPK